jgi:hypothetical protein
MFCCAGKGLSHTAQAKSLSRTMLSWPQAGQRRKTTLCVKPPGVRQAEPVQRPGQGWPGIRARTVTGGLVADLEDGPPGPVPREKYLTGGQYRLPGRAVDVLAAAWR